MSTTREAGDRGEAMAAEYLRENGYELLASQFRCRFGKRLILKPHQQDRLPLRFGKLRQGVAQGLHLIHGFLIAIRRQAVGGYIEIHPADKMFRRIPDRDLTAVRTLEGPADKERRNGADFQCNDNRTSFQDRSLLCDSI